MEAKKRIVLGWYIFIHDALLCTSSGSSSHHMTKYEKAKRQLRFATEYLELAEQYYPVDSMSSIKGHIFRFLYQLLELPEHRDVRDAMAQRHLGPEGMALWVRELDEVRYATEATAEKYTNGKILSSSTWYRRHRASGMVVKQEQIKKEKLMGLKERLEMLRDQRARSGLAVSGLASLNSNPSQRPMQQM